MAKPKTTLELADFADQDWEAAIALARDERDSGELERLLLDRSRNVPTLARKYLAELASGRARLAAAKRGRKPMLSARQIARIRDFLMPSLTKRGLQHLVGRGKRPLKKVVFPDLAAAYGITVSMLREIIANKPRRRFAAKGRNLPLKKS